MSPAFAAMLLALVVAPAVAYLVYRLARGLGFLDPPADKQHEHTGGRSSSPSMR